jgi:hypothetical protein
MRINMICCYSLSSQAHVNRLATRAVSCPVRCSIHEVPVHHDRPSNILDLFRKHSFPIWYVSDLNITISRLTLPAVTARQSSITDYWSSDLHLLILRMVCQQKLRLGKCFPKKCCLRSVIRSTFYWIGDLNSYCFSAAFIDR